jgi:preprotein translocase subunit SecD
MPAFIRAFFAAIALLAALVPAALAAPLSLTVLKAEATTDLATGEPVVSITFDAASTEALAAFTRDNVGRQTVIRIAGEEIMRPIIREPIIEGTVQISGSMTMADARDLALGLTLGDARIEIELVEE